ncbi:MAG: YraN family protein [Candidatus Paceibacterota bacterium]|jgi:putative endonuclease
MKNFTSDSQIIGKLGEDVACKFLMKHGYSILERNYTKKWGEIDIIAQKGEHLYFIEVKSKSVPNIEELNQTIFQTSRPEDNMHPWKLKRLSRTIQTYLIHKRMGNIPWQFDLLVVYLDVNQRKAKVKRVENIIL